MSQHNRLYHFCSYDVVEKEVDFLLECPLDISSRDKFQPLFEYAILGSLKSFFQVDQQVNISHFLTKATALHHSRK
jgi:hypothetical protein